MIMEGMDRGFDVNPLAKSVVPIKGDLLSRQSNKPQTLPSRKKHKGGQLQSKFDTRLADAALRQAAEGGYLMSPTRAFLLERFVCRICIFVLFLFNIL